MTVALPDVDFPVLFENVVKCEHIHDSGARCDNKATWVCQGVPCGCPRFFCHGCKAIVQRKILDAGRKFRQGRFRCTTCDERVYNVDWSEL